MSFFGKIIDVAKMTPLLPMYSLGHSFIPAPIHAGGLVYHGIAPLVSAAIRDGLMEAQAIHQSDCFEAGLFFPKLKELFPLRKLPCHCIGHSRSQKGQGRRQGKSYPVQLQRTRADGFGGLRQIFVWSVG
jgi:tryptophan synthase beta chain